MIEKPISTFKKTLTFHLIAFESKDSRKILNLLYRIDLSEEIVKSRLTDFHLQRVSKMIVIEKGNSKELLPRPLKSVVFVIIYE